MIAVQTLTDQDADDPAQVETPLNWIDGPIVRVTADSAYDGALTCQTISATLNVLIDIACYAVRMVKLKFRSGTENHDLSH
jgi:hypothetical protein